MVIPMCIPMASGLGRMFSSNPSTFPRGIPMELFPYSYGQWPRENVFLKSISYFYKYPNGAMPMGVPMCIPMASGLGKLFSSNPLAILIGIPMELFL